MGLIKPLAFADDMKIVPFSLSTSGSFNSGNPTGLAFNGSKLSGESDEDGSLILEDLGTFTLTNPSKGADVFHRKSDTFSLELIFFSPRGIQGNAVFDATLQGKVERNGGSVFIDFGVARSFNFTNDAASGGFDLAIDDITLTLSDDDQADSQVLTGRITNAFDPPSTIPEPTAAVLLGTIVLFGGFAFRYSHVHRS